MSEATQEEARAREVFAAGTVSCGEVQMQVSAKEVRRLETELEAARRAFERKRTQEAELDYIDAHVRLRNARAAS